MRPREKTFLLAALFLAALTARAANSGGTTMPPSVPASDDWLKPNLPTLVPSGTPLSPMEQLDASAFTPKITLLSLASVTPPETSTPAQLEARLTAYVGTWRGESTWCSSASPQVVHYPTEIVYRFEQQDGRRVLACLITYTINGAASVNHARLWIENGRIVSEVVQNGQPQRYIAQTELQNLVWHATNSDQAALDYGEIETLRLTADGGEIHTQGFEIEHGRSGPVFIHESSLLKLVK
jgi:hypothetical protein